MTCAVLGMLSALLSNGYLRYRCHGNQLPWLQRLFMRCHGNQTGLLRDSCPLQGHRITKAFYVVVTGGDTDIMYLETINTNKTTNCIYVNLSLLFRLGYLLALVTLLLEQP